MKNPNRHDRLHCIPVGDVHLHAAQESCWCHPTEVDPGVWVHNAKDCRESGERRGVLGEPWVIIGENLTLDTRQHSS